MKEKVYLNAIRIVSITDKLYFGTLSAASKYYKVSGPTMSVLMRGNKTLGDIEFRLASEKEIKFQKYIPTNDEVINNAFKKSKKLNIPKKKEIADVVRHDLVIEANQDFIKPSMINILQTLDIDVDINMEELAILVEKNKKHFSPVNKVVDYNIDLKGLSILSEYVYIKSKKHRA